ncbi:hypothetical protein A1D30_01250 [Acidovorax sp. GW101-3H11]|uniref:hypothetical protein n=1 Tax=Acidovorax sp. GW101-3H11 TaxID=1813946 RepID=UPI0007B52266|nr:hypothetical protein [Acidovorax sp. GW101-3H11]KZT17715.1 hypothetical protein A1D30_01250 [Acidovorax sp. GW101-3H11]
MKLTQTERWLGGANITLVVVFSTWSFGVAYGVIPISACCSAPGYIEAALATLNFPSWILASLAAKALFGQDFTAFVSLKQLLWIALCFPQWFAYISIYRLFWNRQRPRP